jgi:hypothetical protein
MWSIELISDETVHYITIDRERKGSAEHRAHWFRGVPTGHGISWESIERVLALVSRAANHKYLHAYGWEASGEDATL